MAVDSLDYTVGRAQEVSSSVCCAADTTIIIPTLNEEENILRLLEYLDGLYPGIAIIVVDDMSTDSTADLVRKFADSIPLRHARNVKLLVRKAAKQKGITASVLDALPVVQTKYLVVMDGDLQHPPEIVSELVTQLRSGADLVNAARRATIVRQSIHRMAMTWVATYFAKQVLGRRGFALRDPMSGFFGVQTPLFVDTVKAHHPRFEPAGYKVLFDLLRCIEPDTRVQEVSYDFGARHTGTSKLRPIHAFYFFRSVCR